VIDRSEHPVYNNVPVGLPRLPPTQLDAVIMNESAPHYSPGSLDCYLTLVAAVLTRWLPSHLTADCPAAAAGHTW